MGIKNMEIRKIEISFPHKVKMLPGFDNALYSVMSLICKEYNRQNDSRIMWVGREGFKAISCNEYDESVYCIEVVETEKI